MTSVSNWAEKFMEPVMDEENIEFRMATTAKTRPEMVLKVKRYIEANGDLLNGCQFPDIDIDITMAIIMRFIHKEIFQKVLYGSMSREVEVLSSVEHWMRTYVQPRRGKPPPNNYVIGR